MIPTIPLNIILIYLIVKVRQGRIPLFYKLLLNIAAADLMTGVIGDPISVNIHIKEALQKKMTSGAPVYVTHLSLFLTDAVALITMTFLSFDRIVALLYPIKYHNGMKARNENFIVAMIYPSAIVVISPYFKIKFIKQLAVFASLNITLSVLSLVATITVLRKKAGQKKKRCNQIQMERKSSNLEEACACQKTEQKKDLDRETRHPPSNKYRAESQVTKTFLIMAGVFIVVYLPTCVTMVYMNSCGNRCNCFIIHVMRDISIVSILSSSVFRPLVYLMTIRTLRKSLIRLFCKGNN